MGKESERNQLREPGNGEEGKKSWAFLRKQVLGLDAKEHLWNAILL